MYKIDFEICIKCNPSHIKEEIDSFLEDNLYKIQKRLKDHFAVKYIDYEIILIGNCINFKPRNKTYREKVAFIKGHVLDEKWNLDIIIAHINMSLRNDLGKHFSNNLIMEITWTNLVKLNSIYYYYILLKEKMQSAISSLKQKFLC